MMKYAAQLFLILITLSYAQESDESVLRFSNNSVIHGNLTELNDAGDITLESSLSPTPISLLGQDLEGIYYAEKSPAKFSQEIKLTNGDSFPVDIFLLDDKQLTCRTPWTNQLIIPRSAIDALLCGVTPNQTIYNGPSDKDNWTLTSGWSIEDNELITESYGFTNRLEKKLTPRYIFRFDLIWRKTVNAKILFSANHAKFNEMSSLNAYTLTFSNNGLDLRRVTSETQGNGLLLASIPQFTAKNCKNRTAQFEIRVDTIEQNIQLFCNGKAIRKNIKDPSPPENMLTGKYLGFQQQVGSNDELTISDINIETWESDSSEALAEDHPETSVQDIIYDKESNRASGKLLSMSEEAGKKTFHFENPLAASTTKIPFKDVSIVYFSAQKKHEEKDEDYSLYLHPLYKLSLNHPTFSNNSFNADHPLIGKLQIPSQHVKSFVKNSPSTAFTRLTKSYIEFLNGDILDGSIAALDHEKSELRWKSSTLKNDTNFFTAKIKAVNSHGEERTQNKESHIAWLTCHPDIRQQNERRVGDSIYGELASIDQENAVLSTWYAGNLAIKRSMIAELKIKDSANALYVGPNNSEDWKNITPGSWRFDNQTLIAERETPIARNFDKLPDRYHLQFHAYWSDSLDLQVAINADDIDPKKNSMSHFMVISDNQVFLKKLVPQARFGGFINHVALNGKEGDPTYISDKEETMFHIYVDKISGDIALFANDTMLRVWKDTNPPVVNGSAIRFNKTERNSTLQISRIKLSTWNGEFPTVENDTIIDPIEVSPLKENEQKFLLRNGDTVVGGMLKVENKSAQIKTALGDISLPLVMLKNLDLKSNKYDERILQNGDIRAWFDDERYITFRLDGIADDGKLIGSSQAFGTAQFIPSAFRRIEFNLYPPMIR